MAAMTDISADDPPQPRALRAWAAPALEAITAFGTAGLFLAACLLIRVNPRDRLGQISGLASLELRFFLFGIVLLVALIVAARVRGGRHFDMTSRLACAAIAGLATGLVAGGILVALRGTPWGLHTKGGDVSALTAWATALHRGEPIPPLYPPLSLHVLAEYSNLVNLPPDHAIKHLQIIGTAAFGPLAYLGWRLLLRPVWALGIGVIATIPLIEPYKPYPNLVLVLTIPLAILFLKVLREVPGRHWFPITRAAVGFGVVFGVLCLGYSGWFKWAAPGLFVATLVVFPWCAAWRKGLLLLGVTGLAFLLLVGRYLGAVLFDPAAKVVDTFVYFDVGVEPMYIAMWRNDLPGVITSWPPHGELGGVGLFTIVLLLGLGLAVALGRKSAMVIGLGSIMVGAWLLRFWYARSLWETKLVQLYPRTTPLILYCLIVLTGMAGYWLVRRLSPDHPLRGRAALIGAACGLLLLFGSTGSAISDRYMPSNTTPPGTGFLAWNAHLSQRATKPKNVTSHVLTWVRRSSLPIPAPIPTRK